MKSIVFVLKGRQFVECRKLFFMEVFTAFENLHFGGKERSNHMIMVNMLFEHGNLSFFNSFPA